MANNPLDGFLLKLGTVLTLTKDALLEDFLGDMPKYVPDPSVFDNAKTYEEFKSNLAKSSDTLRKFVSFLCTRLGYDLGKFGENEKLVNLISSIFTTVDSLGESVKGLVSMDEAGWQKEFETLMTETQGKDGEKFQSDNFFLDPKVANEKMAFKVGSGDNALEVSFADIEGVGQLGSIVEIVSNLIELIKAFHDIEWKSIKEESKEFYEFIESSYFNEKFAERLFDHILTVLLSKAKTVFDEEIKAISQQIDKYKSQIISTLNEAKDKVSGTAEQAAKDIIDQINELKAELDKVHKQLRASALEVYSEAREAARAAGKEFTRTIEDFYEEASSELYAQYQLLQGEMAELTKNALGDFGKIGDVLNRIHKVLDFMGLLKTQTIETAKFVPGSLSLPKVDIGEVNGLLKDAFDKFPVDGIKGELDKLKDVDPGKIVQGAVEEAQKKTDEALAKLKDMCPTVEINVIDFSRVQQLLSKPSDYFSEVFPMKDLDDAEALLGKIYEVVKAFNASIPDFSSLSAILNTLLVRIKKAIDEIVSSADKAYKEAKAAVLAKLKKVEEFILDIKKVLEAFAIEVKKQMTEAFNAFKEDALGVAGEAKGILSGLQDSILNAVNEAIKDAQQTGRHLLPDTNIKLRNIPGLDVKPDTLMYQLFAEPLVKVVQQQAKEHKLFEGIDSSLWQSAFADAKAGSDGAVALLNDYKGILVEIDERVRSIFDPKTYQTKFVAIVESLKEEFDKQTAGVPKNVDELKKFGTDSLDKLIKGESLSNPFSGFDYNAYFTIVSDGVTSLIPTDIDAYYLKFKEVSNNAIEKIVNGSDKMQSSIKDALKKSKEDADAYANSLKAFAQDVFTAYWKELKDAIYKLVIRPILSLVETVIRNWVRELIQMVIEKVIVVVKEKALLAYDEYKDVFNEVQEDMKDAVATVGQLATEAKAAARDISQMISDILMLSEKAKGISSWQDGLSFAVSVYSAIPDSVKNEVKDLIPLPKWNLEGVKLPDYKLDMANKFLAVSLYSYSIDDKEKNHIKADVSIQLLAFVGDMPVVGEDGEPKKDDDGDPMVRSGLYLLPAFNGNYGQAFNLGDSHKLELSASASLNKSVETASKKDENKSKEIQDALSKGAIGLFITQSQDSKWKPDCEPLFASKAIEAWFEMTFSRGQAGKDKADELKIYESDVLNITMEDYPQKLYIGYKDGLDFGYLGQIKNLNFELDLAQLNSFFEAVMKDKITFKLEKLQLGYGYKDGFNIDGSASVRIPINKTIDLKAVKLDNLAIEAGLPGLRGINFGFGTNLTVDLSGVKFSFADLGFALDMNLLTEDYKFGDFKLTPQFKMPDGIGLSINIEGTVVGTGALKWNKETGEVMGAAELKILDMVGASALFILNAKPVDGAPFSFMGALCVYFTPGLQLGMGISLSAIGGSLGVHRRIDTDKMRDAVKDGSLTTILFVKDLDKHLSEVLANISSYYPVKKDQFFFGALAQLKWAEIFVVEAGLFIQAPSPIQIILAGGLHLKICDTVDKLLAINANFLGVIDPDIGISFDAELVDSQIVGIELHGSIALRIYWGGKTKGFLLSAGGFHPEYTPEPGFNVGKMQRMGLKLDYSIVKFSMDSYFAVTSNTVQFGSDTRLQIGWEKFGLSGYMYYNVLFQFNPFAFQFDAGVGLAVKCGSWTLMSVAADLDVSGPAQWHVKGKASFWFILVKIKISFSKTWGKKQSISDKKYVDIQDILIEAFEENSNWAVVKGDIVDNLVNIAKIAEEGDKQLVMNPFDTVGFNQSQIPFNTLIERYGEAVPGDITKVELDKVGFEGDEVKALHTDAVSSFAPSLTKNMTDAEKLHAPSYKDVKAGFNVKVDPESEGKVKPEELSIELESEVQDIDLSSWNRWSKKAGSIKKAAQTDTLDQADESIPSGVITKKSVKPSSRRTAVGFQRYLKELDHNYSGDQNLKIADLMKSLEENDIEAIKALDKSARDETSTSKPSRRPPIRPGFVKPLDFTPAADLTKLKEIMNVKEMDRQYGEMIIRRDTLRTLEARKNAQLKKFSVKK